MITHLFLLGPDASPLVALLTFSDRRDRAFTLTCFRAAGAGQTRTDRVLSSQSVSCRR